jgi:Tfp pilus assembly pilus retraction ATPase PilT
LIDNGKRTAVLRLLIQTLGPVGGKELFNVYQNDIIERVSVPLVGSKFINNRNGLDIYSYNESLMEIEKLSAKTLIVFGETGCGKSTFLNAIVNYLAEVEM